LIHQEPQAFGSRKPYRLVSRDGEHAPSTGNWTMAQRHDHGAVSSHQGGDSAHCAPSLPFIQMHPHCREHDEVKLLAALGDLRQVRKAVVLPFDPRRWMDSRGAQPEFAVGSIATTA
jgi:hypothetical protein